MSTILVVEDDLDIARLVSHNLTSAGHVVVDVHDFDAAEEFDESCQNSKHFQDLALTEDLKLDNTFENIANTSKVEISVTIEEIFEVHEYQ